MFAGRAIWLVVNGLADFDSRPLAMFFNDAGQAVMFLALAWLCHRLMERAYRRVRESLYESEPPAHECECPIRFHRIDDEA